MATALPGEEEPGRGAPRARAPSLPQPRPARPPGQHPDVRAGIYQRLRVLLSSWDTFFLELRAQPWLQFPTRAPGKGPTQGTEGSRPSGMSVSGHEPWVAKEGAAASPESGQRAALVTVHSPHWRWLGSGHQAGPLHLPPCCQPTGLSRLDTPAQTRTRWVTVCPSSVGVEVAQVSVPGFLSQSWDSQLTVQQ